LLDRRPAIVRMNYGTRTLNEFLAEISGSFATANRLFKIPQGFIDLAKLGGQSVEAGSERYRSITCGVQGGQLGANVVQC